MKAIKQTQTRDILDAYNREDISYSRMNEMFNELADDFAIGFSKYVLGQIYNMTKGDKAGISIEQLLEIYKNDAKR